MALQNYDKFGDLEFKCDGNDCNEIFHFKGNNKQYVLRIATQEAKSKGWKIYFDTDAISWIHYCPTCKLKY